MPSQIDMVASGQKQAGPDGTPELKLADHGARRPRRARLHSARQYPAARLASE
jgi:hypothetical protein